MKFIFKRPATYKDIFPNGIPKPLEDYFNNVTKKFAFKAGKFLIFRRRLYDEDPELFLRDWFSSSNYNHVENIKKRLHSSLILVNDISSLNFYALILKYCNDDENKIVDDKKMELDLFKAYLNLNTTYSSKSDLFLKKSELKSPELKLIFAFLDQFRSYEYFNFNSKYLVGSTLIKSIELYQFLQNENEQYLKIFYKKKNIHDWKEYFILLAAHALQIVSNEDITGFDFNKSENPELIRSLIDNLTVAETDQPLDDFTLLKSKPLFHEGDGKYLILFNKFFIDQIFTGIYFTILNELEKEEQTKFRQLYTLKFSEEVLLCNCLKSCFENNKEYKYFTGKEYKAITKKDGEPDSYLINENSCWIFESKDVFIEKKIKQTDDPEVLENIFNEKFLKETKDERRDVGVGQLAKRIEEMLTNNKYPSELLPKDLKKIFPIIVTHRMEFNCPGFNRLLNIWHCEKMEELKSRGIDISKVQPLIIMDIDILILLTEKISKGILNFEDIISEYILQVLNIPIVYDNPKDNKLEAIISFYEFVVETSKTDLFPLETLLKYNPHLFPEQQPS